MKRNKILSAAPKKVLPHSEFIKRVRKSLYYGVDTSDSEIKVSRPLAEYAADLFSEPHKKGHSLNRLTSVVAGKISASPCSLIMALIYLDRLNVIDPGYVRRITPQELFVVSLMVSTKFYTGYDEQIYMEDWAKEGNISENKLKSMELEFLCAIDWNIYISNEQFFEKLDGVERTLAYREGSRRGWLTYTELIQLLPSFTLLKFLLNSVAVMTVSYAASVMTIAGAFFLASQIPGTILYRKAAVVIQTTSSSTSTTGLNVITTDIPTSSDNATQATPVTNVQQTNDTNDGMIISTNQPIQNTSCSIMSLENELMKLEQFYCEETRSFEHLENIVNTITTPVTSTNIKLPMQTTDNVQSLQQYGIDTRQHWLAIKSAYSEKFNDNINCLTHFGRTTDINDFYEDCFVNNARNVNVKSNTSFWQIFNGVMEQALERLPHTLFKLI